MQGEWILRAESQQIEKTEGQQTGDRTEEPFVAGRRGVQAANGEAGSEEGERDTWPDKLGAQQEDILGD